MSKKVEIKNCLLKGLQEVISFGSYQEVVNTKGIGKKTSFGSPYFNEILKLFLISTQVSNGSTISFHLSLSRQNSI